MDQWRQGTDGPGDRWNNGGRGTNGPVEAGGQMDQWRQGDRWTSGGRGADRPVEAGVQMDEGVGSKAVTVA